MRIKNLLCAAAAVSAFFGFTNNAFAVEVSTEEELKSAITEQTEINITNDIQLNSSLGDVENNVVINGNNYTIDGNNKNGINIKTGNSATINNLTLENFIGDESTDDDYYDNYGGAISNEGTLSISNSTFNNNEASYHGGVIDNAKELIIENSIFTNNKALKNNQGIGNSSGGAIFILGDETATTIKNSIFENNSAIRGGAIYSNGHNKIDLIDTSFYGNTALSSSSGGAIYTYYDELNISAVNKDVEFSNNKNGDSYNNYLAIEGSYSVINLNTSENNKIIFNDAISNGYANDGGSIVNINGNVHLNNNLHSAIVNLNNGYLKFGSYTHDNGSVSKGSLGFYCALNLNGGILDAIDNEVSRIEIQNFTASENASIALDLDVKNNQIDSFAIYNGEANGVINISNINLINPQKAQETISLVSTYNNQQYSNIRINDFDAYTSSGKIEIRDAGNGKITYTSGDVTSYNLENVIKFYDGNRSYTMDKDEDITINIDRISGDYISINGQGHTINGHNNRGIQLSEGQNLSINNVLVKNFTDNTIYNGYGSFIKNNGLVDNLSGIFENNTVTNDGGVLANYEVINTINATFRKNTAGYGGAISNGYGLIKLLNGNFEENTATGCGGAIYNYNDGTIQKLEGQFINNTAQELGGAIFNQGGYINISAINSNTEFTGNKDATGSNAISNVGFVNFNADENKSIIMNDAIGTSISDIEQAIPQMYPDATPEEITNYLEEAKQMFNPNYGIININASNENENTPIAIKKFFLAVNGITEEDYNSMPEADKTNLDNEIQNIIPLFLEQINLPNATAGTVEINNNVKNQTVNMFDGTLKLGTNIQDDIEYSGTFNSDVNFNFYGGNVTMQNGGINHANFGNMTLNSEMNLSLDADLANAKMDTISADKFTSNDNKINISNINLISGANKSLTLSPLSSDMDATTRQTMAESIIYSGGDVAYGDIYKYTVEYDKTNAMLNFGLQSSGGSNLSDYAPAVAAKPIAQSGAQSVQTDSYTESFRNMDMFMLMKENERLAYKYQNKYASSNGDLVYDPTMTPYSNSTAWFRPYTTFENIPLKNGPKINNIKYGTYFGYDSALKELGNGWDGTLGVYAGYNGSHQTFNGNSVYQNGGTLGLVGVAYKGNFFTGLTANIGATAGSAQTLQGTDNFTALMGGISSKTGYNFEFAEGKVILQPSMLMSYSLINTFDYTTSTGVKLKSDPLHTIQLEPSLKVIGNIGTWQPYASVSMVWNVLNETKVTADDVALPEVSVKPYVKYGVGVQKKWGDKFTGFGQCYVTNGGRNGVGLQAGLRIALGEETTKSKAAWLTPKKKDTTIVLDSKVK